MTELLKEHLGREAEIVDLFTATFTASEGAEEGALIGALARDLLRATAKGDLFVFAAEENGRIFGCVLCSRLTYAQDDRTVFILAPVAVATDRQGEGTGQWLLRHGLAELRRAGVDIAIVYGDPRFYAKVGFQPIGLADAQPPLPLSQPEGWLGQSLTDRAMLPLKGPSRCVQALDDPRFW